MAEANHRTLDPALPELRKRRVDHIAGDLLILSAASGDGLIAFGALRLVRHLDAMYAALLTARFHSRHGFGILVALILVSILSATGVYGRRQILHLRNNLSCLGWGLFFYSLFFAGFIGVLAGASSATLVYTVSAIGFTVAGLVLWHVLFHRIASQDGIASHLRQRIVLIGWTPEAARLSRSVWQSRAEPCEIVGYVEHSDPTDDCGAANIPCLGHVDELPRILEENYINVAWLTDINVDAVRIPQLLAQCQKEMVEFKIIPSCFPILISGMHVETIGGTPVLGTDALPLNRFHNRCLKRLLDICGAAMGLLLAAPIIGIFGALVYLESPGSIFFSQERIGRKGRRFKMYKIRSMRPDAGTSDHLHQSTRRGDPRMLRVGAFMRRWNIDEVPQFWNVLTGEMSLVGPRPERTYHSEKLKEVIPHYNARYTSKPGVTGWAQVNGLRGDTDLTERILHDIFYMEHWNILFDLQIMLLTLSRHTNAC